MPSWRRRVSDQGGRTCTRGNYFAAAPPATGHCANRGWAACRCSSRPWSGCHPRAGGDGAGARRERIDSSATRTILLGLFAALLAVLAVVEPAAWCWAAGRPAQAQPQASPLALAGIVLNLSCLLWGWHALSTAAGRDPDGPGANRVVVLSAWRCCSA
ncbi:hypothetical protein ACPA9J_16745 [Pseudomonas aeruginosa]